MLRKVVARIGSIGVGVCIALTTGLEPSDASSHPDVAVPVDSSTDQQILARQDTLDAYAEAVRNTAVKSDASYSDLQVDAEVNTLTVFRVGAPP